MEEFEKGEYKAKAKVRLPAYVVIVLAVAGGAYEYVQYSRPLDEAAIVYYAGGGDAAAAAGVEAGQGESAAGGDAASVATNAAVAASSKTEEAAAAVVEPEAVVPAEAERAAVEPDERVPSEAADKQGGGEEDAAGEDFGGAAFLAELKDVRARADGIVYVEPALERIKQAEAPVEAKEEAAAFTDGVIEIYDSRKGVVGVIEEGGNEAGAEDAEVAEAGAAGTVDIDAGAGDAEAAETGDSVEENGAAEVPEEAHAAFEKDGADAVPEAAAVRETGSTAEALENAGGQVLDESPETTESVSEHVENNEKNEEATAAGEALEGAIDMMKDIIARGRTE